MIATCNVLYFLLNYQVSFRYVPGSSECPQAIWLPNIEFDSSVEILFLIQNYYFPIQYLSTENKHLHVF